MTNLAPTPGKVLDGLVARFAPPPDSTLPFHDPISPAKRRLAAGLLIEAYGPAHPLSRIVRGYTRYEHRLSPSAELVSDIQYDMADAWDGLSRHIG